MIPDDDWIKRRKKELFEEAEVSARLQELTGLSKAHQKLLDFYGLLERLEAIRPEPSGTSLSSDQPRAPLCVGIRPVRPRAEQSDRERGEEARTRWISEHAEANLTPIRGSLFRKPNGETLGIAYSAEKKGREGRFFSGLPAGKFECAVLLCQPLSSDAFWIALSNAFITQHVDQLSKSMVGQVKFSVFRRGQQYFLRVPRTGNIPVSEYVNKAP